MSAARRGFVSLAAAVVAATVAASDGSAQARATLSGRVTMDSAAVPVAYAGIRIPEVGRFTQADSGGAFRIDDLAPGSFAVIAEAPGLRAQRIQVQLTAGGSVVQNFTLSRGVQMLTAVGVRAKAPPRVSPKMADFERRRMRGLGRYVTRAELARLPGRQLEEVLRSSGAATQFVKAPSGQTWLISTRNSAGSHGLLGNANSENTRDPLCHVQVVLDGAVISSSSQLRAPRLPAPTGGGRGGLTDPRTQVQGGDDAVDLNLFFSDQLEGVEFYPDATTTPMQYRTGAAACGTLMLWTRDK